MYNKDDNIHKSEALKRYDRRTFAFVELLKDILTYSALDYRDASLLILYLIDIEISTSKIRSIGRLYHIKNSCYKVKKQHV